MKSINLRGYVATKFSQARNSALIFLLTEVLLATGAATASAQTKAGSDWVPVSINAGDIYVISDIKPGTKPSYRIAENPQAFVSYDETPTPGKLSMLSAGAGRWVVTVTNTAGQLVHYDLNAFGVAKPGAPMSPGAAPPAISDMGLKPRPGAGATVSGPTPLPELATISSLRASPPESSPEPTSESSTSSASGPETAPKPSPYADASWTMPLSPPAVTKAAVPSVSNQAIGPLQLHNGQFRNDPSVFDSGDSYHTEAISGGRHYLPEDAVSLMTGTSEVIDFANRVTRISVADSKIADVQVINPFQLNLIAHQPGFTTLAIWDSHAQYQEREVRVDASGQQQVMLNTMVAELDRTNLENQGVNLSVALTNYGFSLVSLPGAVGTPYSSSTQLQGGATGTTSSGLLPSAGSIIPLLLSSNFTYGLTAGNKNVQWQGFFQFLEQHNLGRILAEPHLLANSGEKAKFLSGGEIPIVIAQALNSTIVFKTFGTSVEFIPTVIGRSDIQLLVKPEVSEPDYAHGVQLFGFTVPAFVTRRAETLVRLKDRQTLIIAGLILHQKISIVQKVPYLGDIPYLRGLFHNTSFNDQETDLVMSVTPEIVRPLPSGGQVFVPSNRPDLTEEEVKTKPIQPADAARPRF